MSKIIRKWPLDDALTQYTASPRYRRELILNFNPAYPHVFRPPTIMEYILYYENEQDKEFKSAIRALLEKRHIVLRLTAKNALSPAANDNVGDDNVIIDGGTGQIYERAEINKLQDLFLTKPQNQKFLDGSTNVAALPYEARLYSMFAWFSILLVMCFFINAVFIKIRMDAIFYNFGVICISYRHWFWVFIP